MKLKRLKDLSHSERCKIRYRQNHNTLKTHFDRQGYICYDEEELYKPNKSGRPVNETTKNQSK